MNAQEAIVAALRASERDALTIHGLRRFSRELQYLSGETLLRSIIEAAADDQIVIGRSGAKVVVRLPPIGGKLR